LENNKRTTGSELLEFKKDNRNLKIQVQERENEIHVLQEKYEEMLSKVEAEKYDIQKKNKGIEDALSNEIEFFKKEIARLS